MRKKYIHTIFLLAVCVLLTACDRDENWFIRTIEYNGAVDKPELVVIGELYAGEIPVIYVGESVFFNDPEHNRKIKNSLSDANVQLTVNDGTPIQLRYQKPSYAYKDSHQGYYYTTAYSLREGDRLVFTVSHPNYEKPARVSLQVPAAPKVEIAFLDTTWAINGHNIGGLAHWRVGLQPPTGRHDSYLIFRSMCYRTFDQLSYYNTPDGPKESYKRNNQNEGYTYSKDLVFAECPAINFELGEGYWGGDPLLGLYCPTPTATKDIDVYGFYKRTEKYEHSFGDDLVGHTYWLTDSIELAICATSDEQYFYLGSLINSDNYHKPRYILNFWGDNFIGEDFDIEDIFEDLGSLEGVQIFGNVENGIGHITAFSHPTRHVIYPNND